MSARGLLATMPRYYCDYCDAYLTHDSASVRKQHSQGFKHKVKAEAQTRTLPIDEHTD